MARTSSAGGERARGWLMTSADQHAIGLHISMMFIEARRLPTRDDRVAYMTGQRFRGPHYYLTRDEVVFTRANAEYAADLIEERGAIAGPAAPEKGGGS